MKATYSAAAIAAVLGLSGPAHAVFSIDDVSYDPDAGTQAKIDQVGDTFNFDWSVDGNGGPVSGSFVVSFLASPINLDGFTFGFDPRGGDVSITELKLNESVVASASSGSANFSSLTFANVSSSFVEEGGNELTVTLEAAPSAFGSGRVSAVPLPAAAWLMIGGLGALGAYGRYARTKPAAAA